MVIYDYHRIKQLQHYKTLVDESIVTVTTSTGSRFPRMKNALKHRLFRPIRTSMYSLVNNLL